MLILPYSLVLLRKLKLPKKLGVLERLFGRYLAQKKIQWVECCNGIIWQLDLSDPCHRWIVYGEYEGGQGIRFAQKMLRYGGIYIDSGANIGQWVLYLAELPQVRTLAIEPTSSQSEWLIRCLQQQNDWSVTVLKCGLGARQESADIQCDGPRSTLNMDWYSNKNLPTERIQIRTLDQVLSEQGISDVAFWKLDVEGAELEALRGAKQALRQQLIKAIYFECHPKNYQAVSALLDSFGYQLFRLRRNKLICFIQSELQSTCDLVALP